MRRLVRPLLVLVILFVAAACGDDDSPVLDGSSGNTPPTEAGGGATSGGLVTIKDFSFTPATLEAAAGDEILVRNTDGVAHTVTADDKSFDTGTLAANSEKTITLDKPGTLAYHCNIHQSMKGTIKVS